MSAERLSMRKIREVLRLKWGQGLSHREVARSCGLSKTAVTEYLRRAQAAGLAWPLPADVEDARLERRLFPPLPALAQEARQAPDWAWVHQELRRKGVTLFLLWEEYKAAPPYGYQYSGFCAHYQAWIGRRDLVMRQHHRAGEKLFVDYAGQTVPIVDRLSGLIRPAQVFVAVLGASNCH